MDCFKPIKNLIRWIKFKEKILSQLPNYHPVSGQRLNWAVSIIKRNIDKFDENTGKQVGGYPVLCIHQKYPSGGATDIRIYRYNWKKKKIESLPGAQWGG